MDVPSSLLVLPDPQVPARSPLDGLLPSDEPVRAEPAARQLPLCARKWGRFLDTGALLPGDLVLTRPILQDQVSQAIADAQLAGGLSWKHAQWTHAAVYLGDGEYICESSFKEPGFKWGVNVRSLFDYCNSEYAIRARRPIVKDEQQRIRIAVGAMARIGQRYSFGEIYAFWRDANGGKGFIYPGKESVRRTEALVCSTLYQDAYNFSFQGFRILRGFAATPAHLSASSDFEILEPAIGWLAILE